MLTDRVRRRALETAAAIAGAAALLGGVFWLAREWPSASGCSELSPAEQRAAEAFQAGAAPLHALAGGLVLVAVVRLSAALSERRLPGVPTGVGAAAYAALLLATLVEPAVLAAVGTLSVLWLVVTLPVTGVALLAAVACCVWAPASDGGPGWALVATWTGLLLVLPGHYALVWAQDQPWFCLS